MANYVNFHTHTVGSMLDGHGQVNAYMKHAAELGMNALAITDHGNLHLWMDFYEAGKEHGVKPILGMEGYMARKTRFDHDEEEHAGGATDELAQTGPYHLTLLAKNLEGYKNLIKISSRAFIEGFYGKPRFDYELLEEHADGLVVLSGCLNGPIAQAFMREDDQAAYDHAARMVDLFGEDFHIEVMDHTIEEERQVTPKLAKLAKDMDLKIVPTGDCHYVNKSDSLAHDIMLCVSTGSKIFEEDRFQFVPEEFYLRSYDEMLERFPAEWLQNSQDIADSIEDYDIETGNLYFPEFEIPTDETPEEHFERIVWEGVEERYGNEPSQEVIERTQYEIAVIKKLGFPPYFLVVGDLVRWAKDNNIRIGFGRGSAAGSIVSYALNITNMDPVFFDLVFERFLLPEEVEYEPVFEKA